MQTRLTNAPLVRFLGIGALSTLAYALLFLALAGPLGSFSANLLALIITAVANTAANRRLTFGVRGREDLIRHHLGGLAMFAVQLGMTDGSLAILHAADPRPARLLELSVLLLSSLCATLTRYVGMSNLLFTSRRATPPRLQPSVRLAPDPR